MMALAALGLLLFVGATMVSTEERTSPAWFVLIAGVGLFGLVVLAAVRASSSPD